jgi:hypothetical protein
LISDNCFALNLPVLRQIKNTVRNPPECVFCNDVPKCRLCQRKVYIPLQVVNGFIGNASPVKTLSKRIAKEGIGKRATDREICDKIIAKQ